MRILDSIKKLLSFSSASDGPIENKGQSQSSRVASSNVYFSHVKLNKFSQTSTIELDTENKKTWDSFFSVSKKNPKLIGFEQRSRKQFRHLYHTPNMLVTEAASTIEIVTRDETKQIFLKKTPLEKMYHVKANHIAAILQNNEKVSIVNYQKNKAIVFEFKWQPFRFAMGDEYWLVGTRETYDGPGELYCFDYNGNLNWGLSFNELISSVFGEISFMPYILEVSSDSSDIFIASMDRLYRLDLKGNLKARIALSELKASELQRKQEELQRQSATPPKTEEEAISMYAKQLGAQFSLSFERMSFNSPFTGFAHDPETDMVFMLEEKEGRVSAWDDRGNLAWINTFKNEGGYISWTDGKLIVSFKSGETFWMNRDGEFIYGAKLPKQASTIRLIPNQDKYLVVCQDNRLYELHKSKGELIKGSEGHPGMELFPLAEHNVFFDGGENSQGYFWLAPQNHVWNHFEAKTISDNEYNNTNEIEVPVEIAPTMEFSQKWKVESNDGWYGSRVLDFNNQRIYIVQQAERKSYKALRNLSEKERNKQERSHYLVCLDFNSKVIWRKQLFSSMWSLYLSPDGETLFTSVPSDEEITYYPGHLLMISKNGKELDEIELSAHGFDLEFLTNNQAAIRFASEKGQKPITGLLNRMPTGTWALEQPPNSNEEVLQKGLFGAGLYDVELMHYTLRRTDKKNYVLENGTEKVELNLKAAIYEAYETKENHLILRSGSRTISFYDQALKKFLEIKTTENILSIVLGPNSLVVVMKGEVRGYDYSGKILWKYSPLPKTYESWVRWIPLSGLYVWVVVNNLETVVATLTEAGKVQQSQSFAKQEYHRPVLVSSDQQCFVVQSNDTIESYAIGQD